MALYKKSKEIPALTEAIQSGEVSVSKLRHICPVITAENQNHWIEKAKAETNKNLIDEVAKTSPYTIRLFMTSLLLRFAMDSRYCVARLALDITPELMEHLLRLQEVLKTSDLAQVIEVAVLETLERKDPVKKADRAEERAQKKEASKKVEVEAETEAESVSKPEQEDSKDSSVARQTRKALPKHLVHAINRRDRGQCCYYGFRNSRCDSKYRVEIHHIEPVGRGGKDEYENLVTLCHDHHKLIHETFFG